MKPFSKSYKRAWLMNPICGCRQCVASRKDDNVYVRETPYHKNYVGIADSLARALDIYEEQHL